MPTQKRLGFFAVQLLSISILTACGGGGSTTPSSSSVATVSGSAQKGPFIADSIVTAYQLDENGDHSGGTKSGVTTSGGNFITPELGWTGWTEIEVEGDYIDEITGNPTSGNAIKLSALVNVTSQTSFSTNINLATHLQAARTKALVKSGVPIDTANTQALSEIKAEFNLSTNPADLNVTQNGSDNEALLLYSGALLKQTGPAQTQTNIDSLASDFGNDAVFNDGDSSSDSDYDPNAPTSSTLANSIDTEAQSPGFLSELQVNLGVNIPPSITVSSLVVNENTPNGTAINPTTAIATDPNDDTLTYSVSGNNTTPFAISTGGVVTVTDSSQLDAEGSTTSYSMDIEVTDGKSAPVAATITINVGNVPEVPVISYTTTPNPLIPEDTAAGTIVATLTIDSTGSGAIISGNLTGPGAELFSIANNGEISIATGQTLDFETLTSHPLVATLSNAEGASNTVNVTIDVGDVAGDEAPTITGGFFNINRLDAAVGKVVGSIEITNTGDAEITGRKLVDFNGDKSEFLDINLNNEVIIIKEFGATITGESLNAVYTTASGESNKPAVGYNIYIDFKGTTPKVLPLGDSITFGEGSASIDGNPPAFPLQASYRAKLKALFAADDAGEDNLKLDFIGTLTSTSNLSPNFLDNQNEGWGGRKITDIISEGIVTNSLTNAGIPDIVLIHLGTNDLLDTTAGDEETPPTYEFPTQMSGLTTIIETIRAQNPNVVIFLAQIIGMNKDLLAESFFADRVSTVDDINTRRLPKFNERIAELANVLNTEISPVIVVDQLTGYGTRRPVTETEVDSVDGIHPNSKGETKIAQRWFDALQPFFNGVKE